MPRCRSFLPDLMTVRAVMVRAAMEKNFQFWRKRGFGAIVEFNFHQNSQMSWPNFYLKRYCVMAEFQIEKDFVIA